MTKATAPDVRGPVIREVRSDESSLSLPQVTATNVVAVGALPSSVEKGSRNGELTQCAAWRERLREAVERCGEKHSVIAFDAGIAPETLSRILNATNAFPGFETIVRITHATGNTVGWLLGERGYSFDPEEVRQLRRAAAIIATATKASRDGAPVEYPELAELA